MPKLYLVRHAEPAMAGVLLGACDPGLSEAGRRASRGIVLDVAVIYTSALRRARETAEGVDSTAPRVILPELNEISYGEWDGRRWSDLEAAFPEQAAAKIADWRGVTPPGGEPWAHFEDRVRRAWTRIQAGPFPAAVVGHWAVNAILANTVTGGGASQFQQGYCEVTSFEIGS